MPEKTNRDGRFTSGADTISGAAGIYAAGHSGAEPSRVDYEIVRHRYDPVTGTSTEETTNRTMKVWALDILHEPVTTDQSHGSAVNPCGIVLGHTARFRIEVTPSSFPDTLISWEADPAYRVDFPYGNQGREVIVRGARLGDVILAAQIQGCAGPPPIAMAKVVPETVIPIHAFIICSADGTPCQQLSDVQSLLSGANQIYAQVGRRFEIASLHSITNTNWLDLQGRGGNWAPFASIVDYTNNTGGVEVYFVRNISGANGLTSPNGVVVKSGIGANTLAHELGHAQNLPDVYVDGIPGMNNVTGLVARARMPSDWGSNSNEAYYSHELLHSVLVQRLLMYGVGNTAKRDISFGDIQSIWRPLYSLGPYSETLAPIGFFEHAASNPTSN